MVGPLSAAAAARTRTLSLFLVSEALISVMMSMSAGLSLAFIAFCRSSFRRTHSASERSNGMMAIEGPTRQPLWFPTNAAATM